VSPISLLLLVLVDILILLIMPGITLSFCACDSGQQ
jgi:hypothetical protein